MRKGAEGGHSAPCSFTPAPETLHFPLQRICFQFPFLGRHGAVSWLWAAGRLSGRPTASAGLAVTALLGIRQGGCS